MSDGAPAGRIGERRWFYEFVLPDGTRTVPDVPEGVEAIHTTRLAMIDAALDALGGPDLDRATAIDLGCHQGWFSIALARRVREVLAVDAREEHLEDARLMVEALGVTNVRTRRLDIEEALPQDLGTHDVALMIGVLYHLENPVRALRLLRAATRRLAIIETQVIPHLAGEVEWGAQAYRRELKGAFGVLDETDDTHGPETGIHGICLAPSIQTLSWLLQRVGFTRVVRVYPPPDGYEQLVRERRAMFAATVDP